MLNLSLYDDAAEAMQKLAGDDNVAVLMASDRESQLVRFFGNDGELNFSIVMTGLFQMLRVTMGTAFFSEDEMAAIKETVCECLHDMNEVVKPHGKPS